MSQANALSDKHVALYGVEPTVMVSAPGRVNLIGEHTDYNQGLCLPVALPQKVELVLSPIDGAGQSADVLEAFSMNIGQPTRRGIAEASSGDWTDYLVGAFQVLRAIGHQVPGCRFTVRSNVPLGAGVSSSAALSVAVLRGLNQQFDLNLSPPEIAVLAQRVENEYLGVPCGLMDQMASSVCAPGSAVMFDTLDNSTKSVNLIPGSVILVFNSGVVRRLKGSEYAERRADCEGAAHALGLTSLRHATLEAVEGLDNAQQRARARHILTDNARVQAAVEALEKHDVTALGAILNQGHLSLRDDFETSVPAVDHLVETCQRAGAAGARITGGGFGGCIVTLCTPENVKPVTQAALDIRGVALVSEITA